ncbi:MAG TPA: DUF3887 domain-containing protein [Pseudogracilibacillus sp.]|nr:DUF3887 domain-containing protein [Pseudogracilibacillus sp.]
MKRLSYFLLAIGLIIVLSACGEERVDEATAEKYVAKAEEVVLDLNEANYEAVYEQFNTTMKAGLPVEEMKGLGPVIEASGEFDAFDDSVVEMNDGYYVVVLVGLYSNDKRVYTISFNEEGEIGGLYIK